MPSPESTPLPNVLHLPDDLERRKADDPFAFLDPENLQELRDAQERFVEDEQKKWHVDSIAEREQTRVDALNNLDRLNREYLRLLGVKGGGDYDDYLNTIHQVSINNMSQEEWSLGTTDAKGRRVPGGREAVGDFHDEKLRDYKQSITHRLEGSSPKGRSGVPKIDVPQPNASLDEWQKAAAQAEQAVKYHKEQMAGVVKEAEAIGAKADELLRPETAQPVRVNPNIPPPDPEQTAPRGPDAKVVVSNEMIDRLDVDRNNEIQTTFNHLFAAREKLATLAKGNKSTPEYKAAQEEWAYFMGEYGRLKERRLQFLNPNRTHEDFVRDATIYAIDQISRLDTLSEQKKDEKLHRRFINAIKKNKVVQSAVMGVTMGAATLAQKKDPMAAAAAALSGVVLGPTLAKGVDAMVSGRDAIPHTSYSTDFLRASIDETGDVHRAAQFLAERFTKSEKLRRKKAGRKAVLGGLAATVALISTSMLPEQIDWHGIGGTETIDGHPDFIGHEGSASATTPDHNPFDIDNSGEKGKLPEPPAQPETPKPPVQPESQPPTPPEIPPIFTSEALTQGVNIPLEWGDSALAVGERLGLDPDQQQRFLDLLSQRHDGSTYMDYDGVRLYFNGGGLHLSPADLMKIFNP